jgi:hypothetical protein
MPFNNPFKRSGTSTKFSVDRRNKEVTLPRAQDHEYPKEDDRSKDDRKKEDDKKDDIVDDQVEANNQRDKKADRKELTGDVTGKKIVKDNEAHFEQDRYSGHTREHLLSFLG